MYTGYSRVLLQGSCTCVFAKCTRTHVTIPHDNTDIASNILLTLDCSDNICGCHLRGHFATPPSTNLSIPLSLRLFPLPLRPSEKERGRVYTVYMGYTRMLFQAQLHLCLRKVHPNVRYNPSLTIRILQAVSS